MAFYPYLLFTHITGVLILFIANGLTLVSMWRIRTAKTTSQVAELMAIDALFGPALLLSVVLILASGFGMLISVWGWQTPWIDLSLGLIALLGILGPVINGPRAKAIRVALKVAPAGEITPVLRKAITDRILQGYAPIPGILSLGIVALMTLKPDWTGASVIIALTVVISLIVGAIFASITSRFATTQLAAE